MLLSDLAEQALARIRGENPEPVADETAMRNGETAGRLMTRRKAPLAERILETLSDGRRWRARELSDRLGVARDTSPHLRFLPGVELYQALAELLEQRRVRTDAEAHFYLAGGTDGQG